MEEERSGDKSDQHIATAYHGYDRDHWIRESQGIKVNPVGNDQEYGDKYDISSMFTDTDGNQVRFKRHQIVMQTFFMGGRRRYDTVDHINNMERFDNSIYNLRRADKGVQCGNRKDKPGKHRMVICIGDEE